jgi:DNA replication and repair protein RecF
MRVATITLRDFRSYEHAQVSFGSGLTLVSGPNGAGKTNLLEALYFGCTGRSCRTSNEREVVRFGAPATRVEVSCQGDDGLHETSVGFAPGQAKRLRVDGAPVDRLLDSPFRPLLSVFLPDRLELVKGAPALRRAHVDQLVGALWPARTATRQSYAQALAQRNALIARIRSGGASRAGLPTWDAQLARHGIALMRDRDQAVAAVSGPVRALGEELGLAPNLAVAYRPRSRAGDADELARELAERSASDVDRGFTAHGPHRDDLAITLDRRELRAYGSQGQQRVALLALLLAEREALSDGRGTPPVMLLDDVMSELDVGRRQALVEVLRDGGQSLLTTTELEHVPGAHEDDVARVSVLDGRVLVESAV